MELMGYLAAVFIGIALGLIGGGGSILTVPVLVYLFAIDAVTATTYSLFVVGVTSIVGSFAYFKKELVNVKTAFIFGIPSVVSVFFTRTYIVTAIPQEVFSIPAFTLTKDVLLMVLFALLMILASYSMIRKGKITDDLVLNRPPRNYPLIFSEGILVGMVTGLIGAGGGFLIIPVLVNLLKLPMKMAVGTSLVIIAINSLAGFLFSLADTPVQWGFLLTITLIAVTGILIGTYVSGSLDGKKLKPAFGWFILAMGGFIILKETILK